MIPTRVSTLLPSVGKVRESRKAKEKTMIRNDIRMSHQYGAGSYDAFAAQQTPASHGADPQAADPSANLYHHPGASVPAYGATAPMTTLRPSASQAVTDETPFSQCIKIDYTNSVTCNYPITLQGRMSRDEFESVHARVYWANMEAQLYVHKRSLWFGMFSLGTLACCSMVAGDSYIDEKTREIVQKLSREYAHRGIGFRFSTVIFERCVYMDVA